MTIFRITMKSAFKLVQTCLVLVNLNFVKYALRFRKYERRNIPLFSNARLLKELTEHFEMSCHYHSLGTDQSVAICTICDYLKYCYGIL